MKSSEIKYNRIGQSYNSTRKADPYLLERLIAMLDPQPEEAFLDLGCGTGNYSIALQMRGLKLMGMDPSETMLKVARERNPKGDWQIGEAENTGLEDQSMDGIIATLTLHHWTNLEKAYLEICRVLKARGRMVIFTSTPEQMQGYWLNHYFPQMLADSTAQMPSLKRIKAAAQGAGMFIEREEIYEVKKDLQDQFLQCGKEQPELYFRDEIRKGISSFADLSRQEDVDQGLWLLKQDVESGKFWEIKKQYDSDLGDYLFLSLKKSHEA